MSTAAERNRLRRARRQAGLRCYQIEADELWLEEALLEAGFLQNTLVERTHRQVQAGLQALIDFLVSEAGSVTRNAIGKPGQLR
jgi:hypothetical protein